MGIETPRVDPNEQGFILVDQDMRPVPVPMGQPGGGEYIWRGQRLLGMAQDLIASGTVPPTGYHPARELMPASHYYVTWAARHGGDPRWHVLPRVATREASIPSSVLDHEAEPEWDTATAHDLCGICGWPVSKRDDAWVHDEKNPVEWIDTRHAAKDKKERKPFEDFHPESFANTWEELGLTDYLERRRKKESGLQVEAHDSGDGETIFHCPFCGSGNVVGRSDGSAECGFCQQVFTVQVQPMHPYTPQTIDGKPYNDPNMPGSPGQPGDVTPGTAADEATFNPEGEEVFTPPGGAAPGQPQPPQPQQPVAASKTAAIKWSPPQPGQAPRKWTYNEHPYTATVYESGGGFRYTASVSAGGMDWTVLAEGDADSSGYAKGQCERAIKQHQSGAKASVRTSQGVVLPQDAALQHYALLAADDRDAVLERVRAENAR